MCKRDEEANAYVIAALKELRAFKADLLTVVASPEDRAEFFRVLDVVEQGLSAAAPDFE